MAAAGVFALFLLAHSYEGIVHDARLYVGYALSALHPDTIGKDMILAGDDQSGFTLFPALLTLIVLWLGPSLAAQVVTFAGLLLWFGGAAALAFSMGQGRTRWVVLVFLAVLPGAYGGYDVFKVAEAFAAPRPFAEAFVLFALALTLNRRMLLAVLPLALAVPFHPIMALAGFAVWGWLVCFDPRTRVVRPHVSMLYLAVAVVALVGAAALGAPVADRLFMAVDPQWREILTARSPYLFVSQWSLDDWTAIVVEMATVALAASLATGRVRAMFVAVGLVGTGGLLVSFLFGDVLGSLLVLQVQPWRVTWLLVVFAAAGLALCVINLWRQGDVRRVALAFLVLAWIVQDLPIVAVAAATVALALVFLPLRFEANYRRITLATWAVVAFCGLLYLGLRLYAFALLVIEMPSSWGSVLQLAEPLQLLAIPACVLVVLWALAQSGAWVRAVTAAASVVLVLSALLLWDARSPWQVQTDTFVQDAELAKIIGARDGEVLWIGNGFATWSLTQRSNWVSALQGASAVFSRPLAATWDRRARLLTELEMVDQRLRRPFSMKSRTSSEESHLRNLDESRLQQLCTRHDAPAWLIAPDWVAKDSGLSPARWTQWTAPAGNAAFEWSGEAVRWTVTRDYAVIPCGS